MTETAVVHEIDPSTETEFPSSSESPGPRSAASANGLKSVPLLWENRRVIYRVALAGLAISIVIAFLVPNQYESSVRIMPPESMNTPGGNLPSLAGKASPETALVAGSILGAKGSGALFVELFHSRSVQDRVIERLNLQSVYWARYKQDARKKLDSRTKVSEERKSGVITLAVRDHSPRRARDIAQVYVEELNRVVAQVSTSSARRERVFIEQRLLSVKSELDEAEKQFGVFASKNTAIDIKEQAKAMVESAGTLQGQLIAAQSELQGLEQIYTANNVRVRALRARVNELQRQLQSLRGFDSSVVANAAQPDPMYPSIRKLPLLGVEWANLYRRMKIQETLYELLNQQYELARIQEAKEIPTVNIVDPANVPERKSSPPRLLIILGLTILSVAGAAVWIVAADRWQTVDPGDPGKMFAVRVWQESFGHAHTWFAGLRARSRKLRVSYQSEQRASN